MPRTPAVKRQGTAAGGDCPTKGLAMANSKPYLVFVEVGVDSDQALIHLVAGLRISDLESDRNITQVLF